MKNLVNNNLEKEKVSVLEEVCSYPNVGADFGSIAVWSIWLTLLIYILAPIGEKQGNVYLYYSIGVSLIFTYYIYVPRKKNKFKRLARLIIGKLFLLRAKINNYNSIVSGKVFVTKESNLIYESKKHYYYTLGDLHMNFKQFYLSPNGTPYCLDCRCCASLLDLFSSSDIHNGIDIVVFSNQEKFNDEIYKIDKDFAKANLIFLPA